MKQLDYRGFRSTRFVLVVSVLIVGTVALFADKIDGSMWGLYVVGLVGTYVYGDVKAKQVEAGTHD